MCLLFPNGLRERLATCVAFIFFLVILKSSELALTHRAHKTVALKVLVCRSGAAPAGAGGGLSPPRSSLIILLPLVKEFHGSSGQCVCFPLIDVWIAFVVFLFPLLLSCTEDPAVQQLTETGAEAHLRKGFALPRICATLA